MKVLLAGNRERGLACLKSLGVWHDIVGVIGNKETSETNNFVEAAKKSEYKIFQPQDINDKSLIISIKELVPDIIILSGYSQILKKDFIAIAKYGCINLHGGKLPQYRGSSPMNWALINGDSFFTLSIIQVNDDIDKGDILLEKKFPIYKTDSISELHATSNKYFPQLLLKVLNQIEKKTLKPKVQDNEVGSYYPLRFPEDGLIFFDDLTAEEIHNRIRALSLKNLGVSTYFNNKKVTVMKSHLTKRPFFGEAGRIYSIVSEKGILVCAKDRCLWLTEIIDSKTGKDCFNVFTLYEKFATIKEAAQNYYENAKIQSFFYKDKWLSEQMGKSVYQLKIYDFSRDNFLNTWKKFKIAHSNENYLIFSKVNTHSTTVSKCLVEANFKIIDTNVQYELKDIKLPEAKQQNDIEICFSAKKHQKAIGVIARDNFLYSRFHLDQHIDNDIASQIKQNWVKNYFLGNRGDEMVVALMNNKPIGFLQLIIKEQVLLIDLIAVDKIAQGRGVASSMIKFANTNINRPSIRVGTQIKNLPSTKLYQKLGFVMTQSSFVFHYHSQ